MGKKFSFLPPVLFIKKFIFSHKFRVGRVASSLFLFYTILFNQITLHCERIDHVNFKKEREKKRAMRCKELPINQQRKKLKKKQFNFQFSVFPSRGDEKVFGKMISISMRY